MPSGHGPIEVTLPDALSQLAAEPSMPSGHGPIEVLSGLGDWCEQLPGPSMPSGHGPIEVRRTGEAAAILGIALHALRAWPH